ncbi:hypothetical protein MACH17_12600 [Phaeobacter inhibens]|nr:hypothetical protein MACH17_12600 [Phaeobacter inhibens]
MRKLPWPSQIIFMFYTPSLLLRSGPLGALSCPKPIATEAEIHRLRCLVVEFPGLSRARRLAAAAVRR